MSDPICGICGVVMFGESTKREWCDDCREHPTVAKIGAIMAERDEAVALCEKMAVIHKEQLHRLEQLGLEGNSLREENARLQALVQTVITEHDLGTRYMSREWLEEARAALAAGACHLPEATTNEDPSGVSDYRLAEGGGQSYPCEKCGKPRTKAEGGTTFTVCDECWDKAEGGGQ